MAEGRELRSIGQRITFKTIQLLKKETLGIGSYGAVCKAKCDEFTCAAKILHPTLFDPVAHQQIDRRREHRLPLRRFEQECEFMGAIRHPNIVQYLGTYQDPDTGLPVLLMELMDDSLTHFLESSTQPIPYHIAVNICHDIALALSFLHSNHIVHRDLSSNNVLLIGNVRAKVTDFGMARLGELNPRATHLTFTMCPGTDVFMPPEAVRDRPVYTEKIDCFSFGVITLQMLTRKFPKPGDQLKAVKISDPRFPEGEVEVRVSEIERRQNHIGQIRENHPLLLVACDCLKDNDGERPSAQQLQERVGVLRESPEYSESARPIEDILNEKDRQIRELNEQILDLNGEIRSKNEVIEEQNREIELKQQAVETVERKKGRLQSQVQSLTEQHELLVSQRDQAIAAKTQAIVKKDGVIEILEIEKTQLQTRLGSQQEAHGEEMKKRNLVIANNEEVIAKKDQALGELRDTLSERKQLISKLKNTVSERDRLVGELRNTVSEKSRELNNTITEKGRLIRDVSAKEEQLLSQQQMQLSFSGKNTTRVCTLGSLVEVLKPCSIKWYQIGLCLGLSVEELDTIKASVDHLQETLKLKLKRGEELTWGDVVIALYNVGEDELARQVARTHGQGNIKWEDYRSQKTSIQSALQQKLKPGDAWYLVDSKWMKQWKKYVGYDSWNQTYTGQESANPGPVDNSTLFRDSTSDTLRDHLMEELDYTLLPERAWFMLTSWYGLSRDSRPLARKVVEHGMYIKHIKVEVYLLEFKLTVHPNLDITKTRSFSQGDTVGDLEAAIREEFQVDQAAECRVWHRFMTHAYELLSNNSQTLYEASLYKGQTIILEVKNEDGTWPIERNYNNDCNRIIIIN